ncbi:hypothetical protein Sm713_39210 [Streptomyces sp. TS71-3]|nr:hypothetical protein Sm713_39210 [Streptomyces sp. TS71-3]
MRCRGADTGPFRLAGTKPFRHASATLLRRADTMPFGHAGAKPFRHASATLLRRADTGGPCRA